MKTLDLVFEFRDTLVSAVGYGCFMPQTRTTRKGMHLDRIASAWLIRRVTEPDAVFEANKPFWPR